jgi:hypothetical protein
MLRWPAVPPGGRLTGTDPIHSQFKSLPEAIAKCNRRDPQVIASRSRGLLEQQWCQIAEIPPPDAPVVRAFCFQKRMLDPRLLQRLV